MYQKQLRRPAQQDWISMGFLKRIFLGLFASFSVINQQVRSEPTIQASGAQESQDESDHLKIDLEVQALEARSQFAWLSENSNLVRAMRADGSRLITPVSVKSSGDRIEFKDEESV